MILTTDRLILRPWAEDDAQSLYEYAKDPRVGPMAGWALHTDTDDSRRIIREVLSAEGTYAVTQKDEDKAIGSIGLMRGKQSNLQIAEDEGEIGYWIGVPFWGQGLIPEAVRTLTAHAFTVLGLTALYCGYYNGNEKSKRAQEKCGFLYHHTEENIVPPHLPGTIKTQHVTRLTAHEWRQMGEPGRR